MKIKMKSEYCKCAIYVHNDWYNGKCFNCFRPQKPSPKMTPYWHKIPKEDQKQVLTFSKMMIGDFIQKFRQPAWCGYPDALRGQMGCWSLIRPGRITNINDCLGCDLKAGK